MDRARTRREPDTETINAVPASGLVSNSCCSWRSAQTRWSGHLRRIGFPIHLMQIGPLYNSFLTAHGIPSVPKRWLDSGESVGFQSARRQRLALNFGRSLPAGLFA